MANYVTTCYKKPFYLFHYNKRKLPPLKKPKGPINYKAEPKVPIKLTNATKMRNKVIKEYMSRDKDAFIDFKMMAEESAKTLSQKPEYIPRDTKASQFRYKWVREVPVVSCRFTEHMIMFRKPPFTYEKSVGRCGQFRLRNMEIKDPEPEPEEVPETPADVPLIPSILQ